MTEPRSGQPWTNQEIEVALDAYFVMLAKEISGEDFVKSDYRRRCAEQLPVRSDKSIEFKWCNISAVLDEMDLPWIDGYKPMPNYQRKLRTSVDSWLARNPRTRRALAR